MKKKSILFVMPSMVSGGAERALLNLLHLLDYNRYDVDLFLFNHSGLFYNQIPIEVNLLKLPESLKATKQPLNYIITLSIKNPKMAFWRIVKAAYQRLPNYIKNKNQKSWEFTSKLLPMIEKKYDVAIGFMQTSPIYMIVDKVKTNKKIGYVHTDYFKKNYSPKYDRKYFSQLDNIVTVSEESANVLKKLFPRFSQKISIISNMTSKIICEKLAEKFTPTFKGYNGIKVLTIGRLVEEKGYDLAISGLKILIEKGYDIKWYVIGTGAEKEKLQGIVKMLDLQEKFIFLGEKANPYPYILYCNIYVQPSRYEGWGIALEEALLLNKVVVATNFETAYKQIKNGVNGIICQMTPESISESIVNIIENPDLQKKIEYNLNSKKNFSTKKIMNQFYKLIN